MERITFLSLRAQPEQLYGGEAGEHILLYRMKYCENIQKSLEPKYLRNSLERTVGCIRRSRIGDIKEDYLSISIGISDAPAAFCSTHRILNNRCEYHIRFERIYRETTWDMSSSMRVAALEARMSLHFFCIRLVWGCGKWHLLTPVYNCDEDTKMNSN